LKNSIITLLTDFGERDFFVGAMKGVVLSINRDAIMVDISHDIPPQGLHEAAFVLKGAYRHFPPGTIHLAVVDPGVGGVRRPILVDAGDHLFVGPDNGIFTWVFRDRICKVFELTEPKYFRAQVSDTFHGRDVFAAVCGHLSLDVRNVENFGSRIEDPVSIPFPEPSVGSGCIEGEVAHIDRFGNIVSNIPAEMIRGSVKSEEASITIGGQVLKGISRSYSQKEPGDLLAVIGGAGLLEVSINMGNAVEVLNVRNGDSVVVTFPER
jgi:S-adenosylmethionine hydrolase